MYVVRYSTTIEKDIELGFSCWLGTHGVDLLSALEDHGYIAEELEAKFERFGSEDESFEDYLKRSVLPDSPLVFDVRFGEYRTFHHNGLSCWRLEAETLDVAMVEAATMTPDFSDGQATVGNVKIVAQVSENMWLLECDSVVAEI